MACCFATFMKTCRPYPNTWLLGCHLHHKMQAQPNHMAFMMPPPSKDASPTQPGGSLGATTIKRCRPNANTWLVDCHHHQKTQAQPNHMAFMMPPPSKDASSTQPHGFMIATIIERCKFNPTTWPFGCNHHQKMQAQPKHMDFCLSAPSQDAGPTNPTTWFLVATTIKRCKHRFQAYASKLGLRVEDPKFQARVSQVSGLGYQA